MRLDQSGLDRQTWIESDERRQEMLSGDKSNHSVEPLFWGDNS